MQQGKKEEKEETKKEHKERIQEKNIEKEKDWDFKEENNVKKELFKKKCEGAIRRN